MISENAGDEKAMPTLNTCPCFSVLKESLFPARVIYDLLFFFIVIIIVLNLIFGVIIDTFADLRSEKQKKEEILKTTCFICGMYPTKYLYQIPLCSQLASSKILQFTLRTRGNSLLL